MLDNIHDIVARRNVAGAEDFSLFHSVQTGSRPTQPSVQLVVGTLSQGVKWPEREEDLLPTSSAEVKNDSSCTFPPPICIHVMLVDFYFLYRAVQHHIPESIILLVTAKRTLTVACRTAFDIAASEN
jgi:hypothetical protein